MKNVKLTIRVNDEFRKKYKEFCDKKGYSLSKRIRLLLEHDMTDYENK